MPPVGVQLRKQNQHIPIYEKTQNLNPWVQNINSLTASLSNGFTVTNDWKLEEKIDKSSAAPPEPNPDGDFPPKLGGSPPIPPQDTIRL